MSLVTVAWEGVSDKPLNYAQSLEYSGRFRDYNGSIVLHRGQLAVKLSKKWKDISSDIQIGMIQHLLVRLFRLKKTTVSMDLYESFLRNVPKVVAKESTDPVLESSFVRINDRFFTNTLEQPNLIWSTGRRRLGSYHFGSDTVAISRVLAHDLDLLDYVMYHELLHKFHKFSSHNGRSHYHSRAFREDEQKYPGAAILEKRLSERLGNVSWE